MVSRIKHKILADYLPPWATILGRDNRQLRYIDCFAGGGSYVDEHGEHLPGSPLIALTLAKNHAEKRPGNHLLLGFVEKNHATAKRLRMLIQKQGLDLPDTVRYFVEEEDAEDFTQKLIAQVKGAKTQVTIPTFFFVDPYGHPISIPIMRDLLKLDRTELLVNLMWFRMAMNLENPKTAGSLDKLFGHGRWREQAFMHLLRTPKETAFLEYFANEVGAKYSFYLPVPFSPEDRVQGGQKRKKMYLVHFSNHPKAALLMKEVMWHVQNEFVTILSPQQPRLVEDLPDLPALRIDLVKLFRGREIAFDDLRAQTLRLPYIETHYNQVLKAMEGEQIVVTRVDSKKTGLRGRDRVRFL